MRPLDPTPSLQPHYEPSSLLRVGPPQCSASVRSPRGFRRLGFSLRIRATGSCSSAQQPTSGSRPLYAGRRPLSHQAPRGLVPGGLYAPGFDDTYFLNDASSKGLLSFVSRMLTCTGLYPRFSSNAHHHGSLPQQLGSVWDLLLKADPEGPSLIYCAACYTHGYLVHGELLIRVLLQHTEAEKVFLVDLVEDGDHGMLDKFVFDSRDSQRELHTTPASFWDGPRSVILSTHFVGKASQYLRHGA